MAISYEVDPISRIEGHLGVKVETDAGRVIGADVHGNLWRGFENFLIGREINDAITFTQRICGVCPVPHGQASTFAADAVLKYNDCFQTYVKGGDYIPAGDNNLANLTPVAAGQGIPAKAVIIRNLVLSAEFLMSSLVHQYHLAAPSYVQGPNIPPWTPYFDDTFYHPLLLSEGHGVAATTNKNQPAQAGSTLPLNLNGFSKDLWSAVIKQYVKALRIRRLTFEASALFAGRAPMTSCYVAGGVTTDHTEDLTAKCDMYFEIMKEVGTFIAKEYVPLFLALGVLYPNYDNLTNATVLQTNFDALWDAGNQDPTEDMPNATSTGWGGGCGNFLCWGAFPQTDGTLGSRRGYIVDVTASGSVVQPIVKQDVYDNLTEHIAHSRYAGSVTSLNADGTAVVTATDITEPATEVRTIPDRTTTPEVKYSWLKAPRWDGNPMEVGPLARAYVNGYFEYGETLASTVPLFGEYVKAGGLDPAMINADLAVALVRTGLGIADLQFTANLTGLVSGVPNASVAYRVTGTDATNTGVSPIVVNIADIDDSSLLMPAVDPYDVLAAAYNVSDAKITGALTAWCTNIVAGLSIMDRLRSRAIESLVLVTSMIGVFSKGATGLAPFAWPMGGWVDELAGIANDPAELTYEDKNYPPGLSEGFGATEAPRGALMHMCTIDNGKIVRYQCIVPTTWNASPKDASDVEGPMEQAMTKGGGLPYSAATTTAKGGAGTAITAAGGVEALRVAQSFDPCIACAVH